MGDVEQKVTLVVAGSFYEFEEWGYRLLGRRGRDEKIVRNGRTIRIGGDLYVYVDSAWVARGYDRSTPVIVVGTGSQRSGDVVLDIERRYGNITYEGE